MKKLNLFLGISVLFAAIIFVSCEKNENIETVKLKVNDFKKIGQIHNDFLTNVKENFTTNESITNEQDKINAINNFNKDFVNTINLSSNEKDLLKKELDGTKTLMKKSNLISKAFGINYYKSTTDKSTTDNDTEPNLIEMIESLSNNGTIGNESAQILSSLANDLKDNYEGTLSDSQLKTNVVSLINEFNDIGFSEDSEGVMVGTVLAISISSIEWWEQNPDAIEIFNKNSNKVLIAPWLASDLVGGAVSGVIAASGQAVVNGKVDWGVVGWSALGGAISSSTGAVGKIIKWLGK